MHQKIYTSLNTKWKTKQKLNFIEFNFKKDTDPQCKSFLIYKVSLRRWLSGETFKHKPNQKYLIFDIFLHSFSPHFLSHSLKQFLLSGTRESYIIQLTLPLGGQFVPALLLLWLLRIHFWDGSSAIKALCAFYFISNKPTDSRTGLSPSW